MAMTQVNSNTLLVEIWNSNFAYKIASDNSFVLSHFGVQVYTDTAT